MMSSSASPVSLGSVCILLIFLTISHLVKGQSILCPTECACLGEMVDCSQRKLISVPENIGRHVTKLHLKDNKITSIPDGTFTRNINIKHLMLSSNKLTDEGVNATSFRGLVSLHKLGLSKNKLTTIPYLGDYLGNLTRLLLSNNKINAIPPGVFDDLPYLRMLALGSNRIQQIPTGTFGRLKNLVRLVLSDNRISEISPGSLDNLTALTSINLGKNRIDNLPADVFSRLGRLTSLDLSNNELSSISNHAFQHLGKLGILNLDHNQLSQVDNDAFYGLNKLHQLELGWNQITRISPTWLTQLPLLRTLKVSHNLINKTDSKLWKHCEFLEILDLSYNRITHLKRAPFADLTGLLELSLSHNELGDLKGRTFWGLSALQALDLSHNALLWTGERPSAFEDLTSLIQLNLSSNHIQTITNQVFAGLPTLEYLDLSGNAITSIQNNAFSMIYRLKELWLNSAALNCDCNLKWFPIWIKQFGESFSISAHCDATSEPMSGGNIMNVEYENITCDVEEGPSPVIVIHPEPSMAVRGQNVSLACTAMISDDSPYTFNWLKDGEGSSYKEMQSLQDSPNPSVQVFEHKSSNNTTELTTFLHLTDVQQTSQGIYQCSISNNFGRQVSTEAEVKVYTPAASVIPMITEHPKSTFVSLGGFATMKCVAVFSGDSPYSFTWYRNGKPLTIKDLQQNEQINQDSSIEVIENDPVDGYMRKITSTLHLANVRSSELEGVFQCAIANNHGQHSSKEAYLIVIVDDPYSEWPRIVTHPRPVVALVDQNMTLSCNAVYVPNPDHEYHFMNWLKDGQPLYTQREMLALVNTNDSQIEWIVHERLPDPDNKYIQELTTLLHLTDIQEEDQGSYQCTVTNPQKEVVSEKAEVIVYGNTESPVVIQHPESTIAMRGTDVVLTCIIAFSGDGPYVANWLKNAEGLYTYEEFQAELESPNPRVQVTERQIGGMREFTITFYLNNIAEIDEGTYQCSMSSMSRKISNEAVITVQAFPRFTSTPKDNTVALGGNVKLECGIEGYPKPILYWMKDDDRVFPADKEMRFIHMPYTDDFFIVNAKQKDEGMYSCMASNDAGEVVTQAMLTVTVT